METEDQHDKPTQVPRLQESSIPNLSINCVLTLIAKRSDNSHALAQEDLDPDADRRDFEPGLLRGTVRPSDELLRDADATDVYIPARQPLLRPVAASASARVHRSRHVNAPRLTCRRHNPPRNPPCSTQRERGAALHGIPTPPPRPGRARPTREQRRAALVPLWSVDWGTEGSSVFDRERETGDLSSPSEREWVGEGRGRWRWRRGGESE
ncbi:uncharacterized protein GGS25DRAFT_516809 [Hypoxylon fragiforme]|uniref:uncharacterized protein n=1 Tax=Hypoxylon fragiforme TaxID=63214 RepID=UPI0020C6FE33|nr:uncharacterized protein GGS25DRAFT_516809 [Hypoxylon fragiforme]KAI2613952.1 hypothetical protein GGS25DRAFT_516809 [Hypoxylon fragiforme]